MKEKWKKIKDYERYAVSNLGRVRNTETGKVLKHMITDKGYSRVGLSKSGKTVLHSVHRLVAKAFIPNPDPSRLIHVNHTKEKADNRAVSLEWRSPSGHGQDRARRNQGRGPGVHFDKRSGKWRAMFCYEPQKRRHVGYFDTKEEALAARNEAVHSMELKAKRRRRTTRRSKRTHTRVQDTKAA